MRPGDGSRRSTLYVRAARIAAVLARQGDQLEIGRSTLSTTRCAYRKIRPRIWDVVLRGMSATARPSSPHFADGGTYEDPTTGGPISGPAIGDNAAALWQAFPDLSFEIVRLAEAGPNLVVAEWWMRGTNTGSFRELPPTGKSVGVPGVDVLRSDRAAFCRSAALRLACYSRSARPAGRRPASRGWVPDRVNPVWIACHGCREVVDYEKSGKPGSWADQRPARDNTIDNPANLQTSIPGSHRE